MRVPAPDLRDTCTGDAGSPRGRLEEAKHKRAQSSISVNPRCRRVSWCTFPLGSFASELCQGAGAGFNNEPKGLEVCCSPLASAGDEREQRLDFSGRLLCLLRIGQLSTVEPLKVKVPR